MWISTPARDRLFAQAQDAIFRFEEVEGSSIEAMQPRARMGCPISVTPPANVQSALRSPSSGQLPISVVSLGFDN
jgi:hypothetical protein